MCSNIPIHAFNALMIIPMKFYGELKHKILDGMEDKKYVALRKAR